MGPEVFDGSKIPTSWFVFESYLIFGTMAVASSDSHTLLTVFSFVKYCDSSLLRNSPSITGVLIFSMHRTKCIQNIH